MESSGAPSVTLIVGSGLSCLALITLAVVYAALWRYVIDKWLCKTTKEAFSALNKRKICVSSIRVAN